MWRFATFGGLAVALVTVGSAQAPAPPTGGPQTQVAPGRGRGAPPAPVFKLEDHFLSWRLLPDEKVYESIDGRHLWQYVSDLAAISRRYRDAGHPQFWGRIIGTSADEETARWLMAKLTEVGLSDVHMDPIDLAPQWFPQTWELTATSGARTLRLETAQPAYTTPGTTGAGVDRGRLRRSRQRGGSRRPRLARQSRSHLQQPDAGIVAPHVDAGSRDE